MLKHPNALISGLVGIALVVLAAPTAWGAELLWYGHSAFKITTDGGKVILVDPFITKNPKTPEALKNLERLGRVDLILLTHGHGDHVGDTVGIARRSGAKVGLNADLGQTFVALGWLPREQLIRFNKSGSIQPLGPEVTITMVHAEHSSEVVDTDPETKRVRVLPGGEPAGYIVELEGGPTIYHAGDTGVFADMAWIGSFYKPDLALVPIGGQFTMDPRHAAYAVRELLKVPRVVPIHYGTFPPLKGTPEEFRRALAGYPVEVTVLNPGEGLKL